MNTPPFFTFTFAPPPIIAPPLAAPDAVTAVAAPVADSVPFL